MDNEETTKDNPNKNEQISTAVDVATGAAGAAIGLVDPILGVIAAGASPAVSNAMKNLGAIVSARLKLRLLVLSEAAESEASMSIDELISKTNGSPEKEEIAERVFRIANMPGSEEKMRALGRALASGILAESNRSVDEVALMLRAVEDLEAPHIAVLNRLYSEGDRYNGLKDYDLASQFPNGVQIMYSILKTLERHGLAGPMGSGDTTSPDAAVEWTIWDFGILLLEKLFDVSHENIHR